jgi:glycosyltransferase involved in cell wall biosynthesis/SAM-dependent methyltransferase
MRIAVTSAFGWPYVRRGNRVAYELAEYLAGRGNEVHFITTKPGTVRREKAKGSLLIKYYPVIDHPLLTRMNVHYWQTFFWICLKALLKESYDLVYTCLTMDACAAVVNHQIKGTPFVPVLITGEPLYRDAPRAKRLFGRALRKASRLVTISNYVNDVLQRDYGLDGVVIPCPVNKSRFSCKEDKGSDVPRILCTATLVMERKRVPLLVKAFERLIEHYPDAILQLAGERTPKVTRNLLMSVNSRTRGRIEFLDISSDEALAACYRQATVSVIPSLKEPFGMVTTESLASGTPVVGTRSGGTPEILDDPAIGVLIEPDDGPRELSQALRKCIELAQDPRTAERCSRHANRYAWETLGPKYEALQDEVVHEKKRTVKVPNGNGTQRISSKDFPDKAVTCRRGGDKKALDKSFVDLLDGLEITSREYYDIETRKPTYLHFLDWILNRGNGHDSVLVMGLDSHFLTLFLRECGRTVTQFIARPASEDEGKMNLLGLEANFHERDEMAGSFDIIVCDQLLQYWASPLQGLQAMRKLLNPAGVLLLSTQNAVSGLSRFRLLTGRNVYPWFEDYACNGHSSMHGNGSRFYREYTLGEVNDLMAAAGYDVMEKRCIVGEESHDKTVNFAIVPVKTYLFHKIYFPVQRLVEPLRSHLFVAAHVNQGEKHRTDGIESEAESLRQGQ